MKYYQFKQQRNELVKKLAILAIEINEQEVYYADCEIQGHVNSVILTVYKANEDFTGRYLFELRSQPYHSYNKKLSYQFEEVLTPKTYKLIIKELQNAYDKMSTYLKKDN